MTTQAAQYKITPSDEQKALESLVPTFRDSRKSNYLVLRSVNFTHREAISSVGATQAEYEGWKSYDPIFVDWESKDLRQLQKKVGSEVLRAFFMRNVFLQLAIDSQLLTQRAFEASAMSETERDEAGEAAKRYSATNISAMLKVLDGDTEETDGRNFKVELSVTVEGKDVDAQTSRKVASRLLLEQFQHREIIDQEGNIVDIEN